MLLRLYQENFSALITSYGIEANMEKIVFTVINMKEPETIPDIQSLNRKIVAFIIFLFKPVKKFPPSSSKS